MLRLCIHRLPIRGHDLHRILKTFMIIICVTILIAVYHVFVLFESAFTNQVLQNTLDYKSISSINGGYLIRGLPTTISTEEVLKDPAVRKIVPYTLGGQEVRWVEWENRCVSPTNMTESYNQFTALVCPSSNAIDIGAHIGDTAVGIAAATQGGTTYAFEPHPKTFHILNLQGKLNPHLNLNSFDIALMKDGQIRMWWNGVGDGCNGRVQKGPCGSPSPTCTLIKSEDVKTYLQNLPKDFIKKLSLIKIDTEGNDRHILRGLKGSILHVIRPVILMEWFAGFKPTKLNIHSKTFRCNVYARDMFRAIEEINYIPYGFKFGMELKDLKPATCLNYFKDLLLLPKSWDVQVKGIKICPDVR